MVNRLAVLRSFCDTALTCSTPFPGSRAPARPQPPPRTLAVNGIGPAHPAPHAATVRVARTRHRPYGLARALPPEADIDSMTWLVIPLQFGGSR